MSLTRTAAAAAVVLAALGTTGAQTPAAHPASPQPRPAPARPQTSQPAVPAPAPVVPVQAAPLPHSPQEPDLAYGAFQRGYYLTAFKEAMTRIDRGGDKGDMHAMTLLGELYASGLGVPQDDVKAAKWYRLAADRGDRDAMFALGLFHVTRRGGLHDRSEAAKLFASAAKLGSPAAAYDLGLFYLEGQLFPQDFQKAAELFRIAAQAGNSEAQYALATLYKDGRGVPQDPVESAKLLAAASLADNVDAEVEYAITLFNGYQKDGAVLIPKDETRAVKLFQRAALKGSPIAQNRLARFLMIDRQGMRANPAQALKWHLIARAGGNGDPVLEQYMAKQPPEVKAQAEKLAAPWLAVLTPKS